jgi:outer membrane protein assembly factor BamB
MFARSAIGAVLALIFVYLPSPDTAAEPKAAAGRAPAQAVRTWTDSTGQYKLRAKLVDVADGNVRLEKADGRVITIALEKFSAADQKWLARFAPAAGEAASTEGEWPCWLGPSHDGKSPDKGLLQEWPSQGPPLVWKADGIGRGFSGVAVAGKMVYITGEENDRLLIFAFDMEGKKKWQLEHGKGWNDHPGSRGTPAIDGGRLYLLSDDGLLGCFDTATHRRLWVHDAKEFGGHADQWGYAESPLVLGSLVIFKPGGPNCIVALDKTSGRQVWASRGFSAGPEYSSCLPITLAKSTLIVTGTNQGLVAVNSRNGALVWANRFAAGNIANCPTPAYENGCLFWANGYGKGGICLRLAANGAASEAWTTHDMVCHHGGYVLDGGYVYGNHEGEWACLDLKSGKTMWKQRGVGKGSLCWADHMLYLFSENGGKAALAACSPQGLEIRGQFRVEGEGESWAHPVVIGGRLYLRYDTHIYCFDVKAK